MFGPEPAHNHNAAANLLPACQVTEYCPHSHMPRYVVSKNHGVKCVPMSALCGWLILHNGTLDFG